MNTLRPVCVLLVVGLVLGPRLAAQEPTAPPAGAIRLATFNIQELN